MKSVILTIGDEILIGQVINTNAASIAGHLNNAGLEVARVLTVGDDLGDIVRAFAECISAFDATVVTGGLGPTHDDVTKKAVCSHFGLDLVSDAATRRNIEAFLASRGRPWTSTAEEQTLVPRGATVIPNHHGTAPGILLEPGGRHFIAMPGVPYEMEYMMEEFVVPYFRSRSGERTVLHRTLNTTGIAESTLASRIGPVGEIIPGGTLAFLPSPSGVRMRISVVAPDRASGEQRLRDAESRIRATAEKYIFGTDATSLEGAVGGLLTSRKLTLALAESCTGGLIADRLTNVAGSSAYLDRAVVVYSNRSKSEILGIPPELIERHGAVSGEVAEAMARGVRTVSSTDIGISTTGIAGPSGGSADKPVGLVWIGYSDAGRTFALKLRLGDDRVRIKERAASAALDLIRRTLLGID